MKIRSVAILVAVALISIEAVPWTVPFYRGAISGNSDGVGQLALANEIESSEEHLSNSASVERKPQGYIRSKLRATEEAVREFFSSLGNRFRGKPRVPPSSKAPVTVRVFTSIPGREVPNYFAGGSDVQFNVSKEIDTEGISNDSSSSLGGLPTSKLPGELTSYLSYSSTENTVNTSTNVVSTETPVASSTLNAIIAEVSENSDDSFPAPKDVTTEVGTPNVNLNASSSEEKSNEVPSATNERSEFPEEKTTEINTVTERLDNSTSSTEAAEAITTPQTVIPGVSEKLDAGGAVQEDVTTESGTTNHNLNLHQGLSVEEKSHEGSTVSERSLFSELPEQQTPEVGDGSTESVDTYASSTVHTVGAGVSEKLYAGGAVQENVTTESGTTNHNLNLHQGLSVEEKSHEGSTVSESSLFSELPEQQTPEVGDSSTDSVNTYASSTVHRVGAGVSEKLDAGGAVQEDVTTESGTTNHNLNLNQSLSVEEKSNEGSTVIERSLFSELPEQQTPEVGDSSTESVDTYASSTVHTVGAGVSEKLDAGGAVQEDVTTESGTTNHNLNLNHGLSVEEKSNEGSTVSERALFSELPEPKTPEVDDSSTESVDTYASSTVHTVGAGVYEKFYAGGAVQEDVTTESGTTNHNLNLNQGLPVEEKSNEGSTVSERSLFSELPEKQTPEVGYSSTESVDNYASTLHPSTHHTVVAGLSENLDAGANVQETATEIGTPNPELNASSSEEKSKEVSVTSERSLFSELSSEETSGIDNFTERLPNFESSTKAASSISTPRTVGAVVSEKLDGSAAEKPVIQNQGSISSGSSLTPQNQADVDFKQLIINARNKLKHVPTTSRPIKDSAVTKGIVTSNHTFNSLEFSFQKPVIKTQGSIVNGSFLTIQNQADFKQQIITAHNKLKPVPTTSHPIKDSAVAEDIATIRRILNSSAHLEGNSKTDSVDKVLSVAPKQDIDVNELINSARYTLKHWITTPTPKVRKDITVPEEVNGDKVLSNPAAALDHHLEIAGKILSPKDNTNGFTSVRKSSTDHSSGEGTLFYELDAQLTALHELISSVPKNLKYVPKYSSSTKTLEPISKVHKSTEDAVTKPFDTAAIKVDVAVTNYNYYFIRS